MTIRQRHVEGDSSSDAIHDVQPVVIGITKVVDVAVGVAPAAAALAVTLDRHDVR